MLKIRKAVAATTLVLVLGALSLGCDNEPEREEPPQWPPPEQPEQTPQQPEQTPQQPQMPPQQP